MKYTSFKAAVAKATFRRFEKSGRITAELLLQTLKDAGSRGPILIEEEQKAAADRLHLNFQFLQRRDVPHKLAVRMVVDQWVIGWVPDTDATSEVQPAPPESKQWCQTAINRMLAAQLWLSQCLQYLAICRTNNGGGDNPEPSLEPGDPGGDFSQPWGSGTETPEGTSSADPCQIEVDQVSIAMQAFNNAVVQKEFACNTNAGMGG